MKAGTGCLGILLSARVRCLHRRGLSVSAKRTGPSARLPKSPLGSRILLPVHGRVSVMEPSIAGSLASRLFVGGQTFLSCEAAGPIPTQPENKRFCGFLKVSLNKLESITRIQDKSYLLSALCDYEAFCLFEAKLERFRVVNFVASFQAKAYCSCFFHYEFGLVK